MSEVVAAAQQGLAGKYKPYPEYKDSGVEWLQLCPSSWETKALKYIVSCNDEVLSESTDPDMEFEYIDIGGVSSSEGITRTESMRFSGSPSRARRIVRQGDIIVSTVRTYLEAIAPISLEFDGKIASTGFAVLRPKYLLSGFAQYALRARHFIDSVVARSTGVSYPAINSSELIDIKIIVPSLKEQQTIAAFLDYETARIDRLIAQQQRLIELLKEKRQAVISHAVTKGLNPNAPMKDSGVEWLGQVPEHWIVCRIKHIKSSQPNAFVDGPFGSNLKSEHFIENGDAYVIESSFATTGSLDTSELKTITNEHFLTIKRSSTIGGDIIIAKIGARFGSTAILPVLDKPAVVSGNSLKLTVNANAVHVEYVNHLLQHLKLEGALDDGVNVTAQPALSLGTLNNLCFVVPPLEEQQTVVARISAKNNEYKRLIEQAETFVLLLKERRTALISAAVTGKIDLRGWIPPTDSEVAA